MINKPQGLVTSIADQSRPGTRIFVVRGEPIVQGLAWLTCGPVAALLVIAALTGLAIAANSQTQTVLVRIWFVAGFLALPALAWGITIIVANRLSATYVAAIKQTETETYTITLRQTEGLFRYESSVSEQPIELRYEQIHRVHVTPAIGAKDIKSVNLTLETADSTLVLLNEKLGSHAQKTDLALEIENSLKKYAANKNPPASD
jgi:hypothetical protein